ncbi:hypothetical protein [Acidocella aminolytica]|jgi:hypothetical protein|uniref:Uncharacterized protein n=1 Tax=Acidocella aminolytica 101 = DSM 11237 TaxID=1120923 RepID=A0A0D6PCB1_9PROT|nr:hypothetical protein [Acidocella aminolytica]GAN78996.1 hypothetical protein Aam_015_006 [Acidocella aminolytica 101 = DSM 11237]GBQ38368.1 hypothetical protein AA11237_1774 [Acidocella aminolytica 101 = DSM 11237]SHF37391.1 hypothetical protein SAMN02746095_03014 [Acidocella aminolytica 101 = DSM 11237]
MRSLFLATTAAFLLSGGMALAYGGGDGGTNTNVAIPISGNALATDGGNAATTGSTAVNDSMLLSVGNVALSDTRTNTHMHVTFAQSGNSGSVGGLTLTGAGSHGDRDGHRSSGALVTTGSASMSYANASSSGINTVQQNTGIGALQQNSVSLGSYVGSGTGFSGF